MATRLIDKQDWAFESGLLPMHLASKNQYERYILLDGGHCEFCLDLDVDDKSEADYNSFAWSSDVKNYLRVKGDSVTVFNWHSRRADVLKMSVVKQKFSRFLKILYDNSFSTSDDVTPFLLSLFAQLRNLTQESTMPIDAMNLLFKMLISIDEEHLDAEICEKWNIADTSLPSGFDAIVDRIREGAMRIKPNLDFILRHGSGRLFEVANRTALTFDRQFDLFGGMSSTITLDSLENYSSLHYTPRYLVRSIVENALKHISTEANTLRIFDPACGSGAFLLEVLKQLKENNYNGKVEVVGYDISPIAINTTKFLLAYEKRMQWDDAQLSYEVVVCDSLTNAWPKSDIILMNPPFISMELLKDSVVKDAVWSILNDLKIKRRPNMAAAFLYKAVKSLSNGGVIGAVLPSSLLLQEQYLPLRQTISEICRLDVVAKLGNYVFSDALTDSSFLLAQKDASNGKQPLTLWCKNQEGIPYKAIRGLRKMQYDGLSNKIEADYNIYIPTRFPLVGETWNTVPFKDDRLMQMLNHCLNIGSLCELKDVFDVKQGIITGVRDVFEISNLQYGEIPPNERKLYRKIASSQTIEGGMIKESSYIWYPYNSRGSIIKTEDQLRGYAWTYMHFSKYRGALENRRGVNLWWELTRPRTWQFKPEMRLCSKRFGDASSFAIARPDCVVKDGNAFLFKSKKVVEDDYYFYLSYFSSSVFEHLLSIFARTLMKGYDLGNRNIKMIPIVNVFANPSLRTTYAYCKLADLGKLYASDEVVGKENFGYLVEGFYPLNGKEIQ